VQPAGAAVSKVSNFSISGNTGQGTVYPATPADLGAGSFTGTVTVRACLNDPTCATGQLAGSPQTVNVTYTIGMTIPPNAVMPRVVTTGVAGQVVIRGSGLSGVSAVSFGSTPATAATVVNDTEVHASYPATLPAGTLAVTLNSNAIASPGSIVAIAPQSYTQQTLTFPTGETPTAILGMFYDAERSALLLAASFAQAGCAQAGCAPAAGNKLWRYTYSGGAWSAVAETPIASLAGITLSNDGSHLLALTGYSLLVLDPTNPAASPVSTIAAPFAQSSTANSPFLTGIALANDGYGIVSSSMVGLNSGFAPYYLYSSTGAAILAWSSPAPDYAFPSEGIPLLTASADGSVVLAWDGGTSPGPTQMLQYSPETTLATGIAVQFNQMPNQAPALDSSAAKRVIYDGTTNTVCNSSYAALGTVPGPVRVLTVNRAGTRLYALNTDSTLHTYDLTAAVVSGSYPQIGSGSALTVPASSATFPVSLAISPDGQGLFLAGDQGVLVVPAPQ